jgi:hypothetical protein
MFTNGLFYEVFFGITPIGEHLKLDIGCIEMDLQFFLTEFHFQPFLMRSEDFLEPISNCLSPSQRVFRAVTLGSLTCEEGGNLSTRDLGFIYVSFAGRVGCEFIHPAQHS